MSAEAFRETCSARACSSTAALAGVYHRSFAFERVAARRRARTSRRPVAARRRAGSTSRPVAGAVDARGSGYVTSFPNLVGVVSSFAGTEPTCPRSSRQLEAGGGLDRSSSRRRTSRCARRRATLYPLVAGTTLPDDGDRVEVQAWCFRHEPSPDPARMQSFRQHEFVFVGLPGGCGGAPRPLARPGRELLAPSGSTSTPSSPTTRSSVGRADCSPRASATKELKYELVAPDHRRRRPVRSARRTTTRTTSAHAFDCDSRTAAPRTPRASASGSSGSPSRCYLSPRPRRRRRGPPTCAGAARPRRDRRGRETAS